MIERLKTLLLATLVFLSVFQYGILLSETKEPVYQLPAYQLGEGVPTLSYPRLDVLAVPIRMVAHFRNTKYDPANDSEPLVSKHAFLRNRVRYFSNIWSFTLELLLDHPSIDISQIKPVEPQEWDTYSPSIELILCRPLPLSIWFDLVGVNLSGEATELIIDRLYLSGIHDDLVLISDGAGGIYSLPLRMKADVVDAFLLICEEGVSPILPFDVSAYGLQTAHQVYTLGSSNVSQWYYVSSLDESLFDELATRAFANSTTLRITQDPDSTNTIFEDNERRLLMESNQIVLEQTRINPGAEHPYTIWQETAAILSRMELLPEDSFYFDGFYSTAARQHIAFQQAKDGYPVFYIEDSAQGESIVSTLRARGRSGELVSLRYRPLRLTNIRENVAVLSLDRLLEIFTAEKQELPDGESLPLLRGIYEGFLCRPGSTTTQPVWIIEFIDGRRYFYDLATGEYQGYLQPIVVS